MKVDGKEFAGGTIIGGFLWRVILGFLIGVGALAANALFVWAGWPHL